MLNIDPVFPSQASLPTTSTANPAKFAPVFCLRLKFNCQIRPGHPCCKYPLPGGGGTSAAVPTRVEKAKTAKARQPRKQATQTNSTNEATSSRKSPFSRTQQNVKTINDESSNIVNTFNEKKVTTPKIDKPIRSSLFKLRRRPVFGGRSKSAVCRIINCRLKKNHKCCQEQEKTTEVTDALPEETTVTEIMETDETTTTMASTMATQIAIEDITERKINLAQENTEETWTVPIEVQTNGNYETEETTIDTNSELISTESAKRSEEEDKDSTKEVIRVSQEASITSAETKIVQSSGYTFDDKKQKRQKKRFRYVDI